MSWRYAHFSGAGTTQVTPLNNLTRLQTVNVNTAAAGSSIVIRNGDANGDIIAIVDGGTAASKGYGVLAPAGLTCVISGGSPDVTIGYD